MFDYFSDDNLIFRDGASATISMMTWFRLHLLSLFTLVPLIGPIVWLIIYIIIGIREETAPSIRNYIKLQLIITVVVFIFGIIAVFACASLMSSFVGNLI